MGLCFSSCVSLWLAARAGQAAGEPDNFQQRFHGRRMQELCWSCHPYVEGLGTEKSLWEETGIRGSHRTQPALDLAACVVSSSATFCCHLGLSAFSLNTAA